MEPGRRLRVRTGKHYPVDFVVDLGQRNARFVRKAQSPLARLLPWADAFGFFPGPGWDLIHTVNAIPLLSRRPFIVTFEDYLPRCPEDRGHKWLERPLRKLLVSPRCRAVLCMSEYGIRVLRRQCEGWSNAQALFERTSVFYPRVEPRNLRVRRDRDVLRLCFVGADYMRKGGPILVRAHERLRGLGVPVESVVVSALRWSPHDYIGPTSSTLYEREIARLRASGVCVKTGLPNDRVLAEMDAADFLVFPTFHDTFGFVAIEALAGGTPVIAHATCALPEVIEDGTSGVLLPFPNDSIGRWVRLYQAQDQDYADAYVRQCDESAVALVERVNDIWETRGELDRLRAGAAARARAKFDKSAGKLQLESIYEATMGSQSIKDVLL